MNTETHIIKQRRTQQEEYQLYSRLLYPTCLRLLANDAEAEEAMHDTLIYYFSFPGSFDSEAQKRSWLFKVAATKSIDRLRKKHNELFHGEFPQEIAHHQIDEGSNTESSIMQREHELEEEVRKVKQALLTLPPGYRTVLSLFLFEGYDFEEIASILTLHTATVRSQYSRGRAKLREMLAGTEYFTI